MFRDRKGTDEAKFEERERGTESQFICERGGNGILYSAVLYQHFISCCSDIAETKKADMFGLSFCLSTPVSHGFNS